MRWDWKRAASSCDEQRGQTVIDLTNETTLSLAQAARLLPPSRGGRPVTLSCLLRWVLHGVRSPGGQLVRLDAIRLGGRWVTSREALQRFAEALTPRLGDPLPEQRTPTARQRASDRASRALEKLGI
jgi:hypothetical protein